MEVSISLQLIFMLFGIGSGQDSFCPKPSVYFTSEFTISCMEVGSDGGSKGPVREPFQTLYFRDTYRYQLRPLALDVAAEQMYWLDFYRKEIFRSKLSGENREVVLSGMPGILEGMAFDWISKYLYFSDSIHDWIIAASIDGKYQKVIVSGDNLSRPRGIAVDPINRYLFWADSESSKIERSRLDGSERMAIVKNQIDYPMDVSLDIAQKTVYWCDFRDLRMCHSDYDGNKAFCSSAYTYSRFYPHLFFSLAYYRQQNVSFVTDVREDNVKSYDYNTRTTRYDVTSPQHVSFLFYSQIRLFDDSAQPPGKTPCKADSCSHFCFAMSDTNYTCGCPVGMVLQENGQHCAAVKPSIVLYFADAYIGRLYHLTQFHGQLGSKLEAVPAPASTTSFALAVAYDKIENMIYWSDLTARKIYRIHPNGTDLQVVVSEVGYIEGIAIDPIGRLLFWTNNDENLVEVAELDGSNKVVLLRELDNPRGILAYPEKGLLFITDWGIDPRVEMMNMDGTMRKNIAGVGTNINVVWPNALALDKIGDKLYFVDAYLDKIVMYDLTSGESSVILAHEDGPDHSNTYSIVFRTSSRIEHPFGLTLDGDYIYWTDWKTGAIYRVNRFSGERVELVVGALFRPEDIHAYRLEKTSGFKRDFIFDYLSTSCASSCSPELLDEITIPNCKAGHKSVWMHKGCYACNTSIPEVKGQRCECKDKASCIHRINQVSSCSSNKPYLHFGIRECEEEVRPGVCGNVQFIRCSNDSICNADSDCPSAQKCCKTTCGNLCLDPLPDPPPLPCQSTYKACKICLSLPEGKHRCMCPEKMILEKDGVTCAPEKSPCDDFSCQNGGSCMVGSDGKTPFCVCSQKYTGTHCETHIDCYPNPCKTNGTCSYDGSMVRCNCPWYTEGDYCEQFTECTTPYCKNGGSCIMTSATDYLCHCLPRFYGNVCEKDKCVNVSCQNGGSCHVRLDGSVGCQCTADYFGEHCEVRSPCADKRCGDNGTCDFQLPSLLHKCTCHDGYYGQNCSMPIPCYNKCQHSGHCVETGDSYKCVCPAYYYGEFCEKIRHCASGPCLNGYCSDTENGYTCDCREKYTGKNCETYLPCQGEDCGHGVCESQLTIAFYCRCDNGYGGVRCESKINHCQSSPCLNGGTCIDGNGTFTCHCPSGLSGSLCQVEQCKLLRCQNGGYCASLTDSACSCPPNYVLDKCQLYIGNKLYILILRARKSNAIKKADFIATIRNAFTRFCRVTNECPDPNTVVTRRKRDSSPVYPEFKSDDVPVAKDYPQVNGDNTEFSFAVLVPAGSTANEERKVMDTSTIVKGIEHQRSNIESELDVDIVKSEPASSAQTGDKTEKKTKSAAVSAGVSIGVLFVIIPLVGLLIYYIYRRHRTKTQQAGPPVAFSNSTFAPEAHPEFLGYSQDPRNVPLDAPPEYDAIGFHSQEKQPQPPPFYDSAFTHLQNPLYDLPDINPAGDGHYENLPTTKQDLSVELPPYQGPLTVMPIQTDEATGFENPLYRIQEQDKTRINERGKTSTVGIYTTLRNEEEEQAGPLPAKMPLPDSNA